MNKLYNKILNEVYLVQDFDSWDNSEQSFKDTISRNISGLKFVYKICYHSTGSIIQIFEQGDSATWHYPWPMWKKVKGLLSEGSMGIYIEGNRYQINDLKQINVGNLNGVDSGEKENVTVIIIGLPELRDNDCVNMFACSYIVECPSLDVSEVTDMRFMFLYCHNLVNVDPFIDRHSDSNIFQGNLHKKQNLINGEVQTIVKTENMFGAPPCCDCLNKKSRYFWKINLHNGSPMFDKKNAHPRDIFL